MSIEVDGTRVKVSGFAGKNSGDREMVTVSSESLEGTDPLKATILLVGLQFCTVVIDVEKVKQINISNCKRCGVVFESAVVGVDITRSQNIDLQGKGKFYNCDIDQSDSVKLYADRSNAANLTILTNGCPQPTTVIFLGGDEEEPFEGIIPAQYQTKFVNGQLETTPVEHEG
eukprot:CAMPEP_0174260802 /NCGR_PEP_ID=MMETSP0439-20130205/10570_1 /TAXON_ID=0 /ORGANISM="Stereomyxa ramosa, Strain Chinc5" /LENGTH=171 /DNA_ID=CAMNT_0015345133 /DNA_START=19 /DNA_END=534 /DNA_ORIENTATION=+